MILLIDLIINMFGGMNFNRKVINEDQRARGYIVVCSVFTKLESYGIEDD